MATIIKCKMCGGDLLLTEGSTIAECEYCGTQQTVPTMDDDKKLVQFERADRLRRNCEFDKAAGVYESIVADFRQEAEAYWGLVLCKYGIEYVDDPATGKKVPTCHRSSFESIMEDPNFEQVLENADALARKVYRDEAKAIEEIRKGIIEVSNKEEPYDIFICYKETAEDGQRTVDSVMAQDIYDALTEKGYRTFFARITLEDKLGQEYEPYIFAALNSAKVMLAIGTDYEHFNAVWVKNEWSRYLKLMEKDKSKHLIPCFKGIDAYDMPKEFNKLQAQDLGKVGAVQDLLRGIDKLIAVKPAAAPAAVGMQSDDVNRMYIYNSAMEEMKSKKVKKAKAAVKKLESLGDWGDAPQQLEMAKKHLKKRKTARAIRRIITWLIIFGIIGTIGTLVINQCKNHYDAGVKYMEQGKYSRAANKFGQAEFYKDADQLEAEAKSAAQVSDEKLRALVPEDGQPAFFFSDEWLTQVLEYHKITEGDVILHEGNSYNGYLDSIQVESTMTGEGGEITYLIDDGTYLFTSGSNSLTIRIENDTMYLEDGTVYSSAGSMMEKLNAHIAGLLENDMDFQQASELMGVMMELTYSGMMGMDESMATATISIVDNAVTLIENGHDEGYEMMLFAHDYLMELCHSGNITDGQAVYNAAEAIVDASERLLNNGYMAAFDILSASMEYMAMAEAGLLGDDFAVIEQFKMLYDRSEQILNIYW